MEMEKEDFIEVRDKIISKLNSKFTLLCSASYLKELFNRDYLEFSSGNEEKYMFSELYSVFEKDDPSKINDFNELIDRLIHEISLFDEGQTIDNSHFNSMTLYLYADEKQIAEISSDEKLKGI
jgi:hypothetical protein